MLSLLTLYVKARFTDSHQDRRWHQVFRFAFYPIAYRPVRQMFKHPKLGRAAGTMAVFVMSGLIHDYILMTMVGFHRYFTESRVAGFQTFFFILQGLATVVSSTFPPTPLPKWIARGLAWLFILYTAPLFIEPFLRIGLHYTARVPGYPQLFDPYMDPVCPYGRDVLVQRWSNEAVILKGLSKVQLHLHFLLWEPGYWYVSFRTQALWPSDILFLSNCEGLAIEGLSCCYITRVVDKLPISTRCFNIPDSYSPSALRTCIGINNQWLKHRTGLPAIYHAWRILQAS